MDEIIKLFDQSISDNIFSRTEKREIKEKIKEKIFSDREIDFLRNKIFSFALEKIDKQENKNIVQWLEEANKALKIKGTEETKVYFSPGSECKSAILHELEKAEQQIDICIFTLSDNDISNKIIDRFNRGVNVRILSDNEKLLDKGSDIEFLKNKGIPIKIDQTRHHMHHKFAIFDNKSVLTGSYNWTRSAELYNHENIIISTDQKMISKFKNEFNNLWKEMSDF